MIKILELDAFNPAVYIPVTLFVVFLSSLYWYCCTQRNQLFFCRCTRSTKTNNDENNHDADNSFDNDEILSPLSSPRNMDDFSESSTAQDPNNSSSFQVPHLLSFLLSTSPPSSIRDHISDESSQRTNGQRSRLASFENLVDSVIPGSKSLHHVGSSLPVETLRSAVNKLNDRLKYHRVTSKTQVGGGLSSIFTEMPIEPMSSFEESAFPDFPNDTELGSDSGEDSLPAECIQGVVSAFKHCTVLSWLPEIVLTFLAQHCTIRTLTSKDEVLFQAGSAELANTWIVVSGEVQMTIPGSMFHLEDEEETLVIETGRMVTGVSDFLATMMGEPTVHVGTAQALTAKVVLAEITSSQLGIFFDSFEGVREELLTRSLSLLQRVVFTSIFRLSGRYASSFSTQSSANKPFSPVTVEESTMEREEEWHEVVSRTLGIPSSDLLSFAKEKRQKEMRVSLKRLSSLQLVNDGSSDESSELSSVNRPPISSGGLKPVIPGFPFVFTMNANEELKNPIPALYIVLSGQVEVRTLNFAGDKQGTLQYRCFKGGDIAHLALLTKTFAQWYNPKETNKFPVNVIRSMTSNTKLVRMGEEDYFSLLERFPEILGIKALEVCRYMSPIVRLADCATFFRFVTPNQVVLSHTQFVDGMMVILHGRVKYIPAETSEFDGEETEEEYTRGAVLGESAYLTNVPYFGSLIATRRTSLACVPKLVVTAMTAQYPNSLVHIGRQISQKVSSYQRHSRTRAEKRSRSVAICSVSPNVPPLENFISALKAACEAQSISCTVLTNKSLSEQLLQTHNSPSHGDDEMEILSRLQDAEEQHDLVFFELVDDTQEKWNKLCLSQADIILLVVNATDKPVSSPLEKRTKSVISSAKRELVMLHVLSDVAKVEFLPKNTREWISELTVTHSHQIKFHPFAVHMDIHHWKSDLRRLGRWISGNAIGLVLGGGGARGSAHLSVLRTMEEKELPLDFVGGTSIGAFVGGLYCLTGGDFTQVEVIFNRFATDMSSSFNTYRDLTFPLVSYLKGYQFNRAIVRVFGDVNIEDFWINFYCVTTDLTDSRELVHRNGFAWKYIRASMTLTGYLPPICDVQNEGQVHYLVDGGYCDNMPVDAMRKFLGPLGTIVAVDVQSEWKLAGMNFGDELNGWWYLWKWLSPFSETPKIPTASDIQSHLAYISCVQRFEKSSKKWDLYIAPPIHPTLTTLGFSNALKIQTECYPAVFEKVEVWLASEAGKKRSAFVGSSSSKDLSHNNSLV